MTLLDWERLRFVIRFFIEGALLWRAYFIKYQNVT